MPEGDTIHRTAATLRRALVGRVLREFRAPRLGRLVPEPGEIVSGVEARGKHLLVDFSGGLTLHTHMRMSGSWHTYGPGQRWRRSPGALRALIGVDGVTAVCFSAPVVELLDERALRRHPVLRRLGPDLSAPDADLHDALRRMRALTHAEETLGDVLLDQRVACGLGNVYKSEVCHLHEVDPRTPIVRVDEPLRAALLATGARLLAANLALTWRTTVAGAREGTLHVYGRGGEPCRRDGAPVVMARVGPQARVTYWCPTCQPLR